MSTSTGRPQQLALSTLRGYALLLGVLGLALAGVTLAWFYWFIVRPGAGTWCIENGVVDMYNTAEPVLFPLGARCVASEVHYSPGWLPTVSLFVGIAVIVAGVILWMMAEPRRRWTTSRASSTA